MAGVDLSRDSLEKLYSVYPFNRFEYAISHLLAMQAMTLEEYTGMRDEYHIRNKYLHLYQITAPRAFGSWAERHLTELVPEFLHPCKKLDKDYNGEYDLYCEGIRIEVKASRAVDSSRDVPLIEKALLSSSSAPFNMNFQQLKPACCDVFVWVGVWCDELRYWVLSAAEVQENPWFSRGQHRGNGGEGQLWITQDNIGAFEACRVSPRNLIRAVKEKARLGQRNG